MQNKIPLYNHSASYAREHWELEEYRASRRACLSCKDAISQAVRENYANNSLSPQAVRQVLRDFRPEQVCYVLAATVQYFDYDGRFHPDNKAWAKTIPMVEDKDAFGDDRRLEFVISGTHPGIVDLFTTQLRRELEQTRKTPIRDFLNQPKEKLPVKTSPAPKTRER